MFKKPKIEIDVQDRKVYRGAEMEIQIPKAVLLHIKRACHLKGLKWDKIKDECVLYIDRVNDCTLKYDVNDWMFSGILLLTFDLNPEYEHSLSYPDKRENMKRFRHHKYRC
ncbi:hypothetical protein [Flagellimonas nanhaiensis]|uniref:Uncharacterized protein n=1 Tax=Flagellimonas nanhaiensis TaxID=2292706 RepID=A0A371JLQ8_9FLAO|nr:hypothetical protein [Allomuricauda nanhaiensis]RDY58017.1 hypothetical protein DX873_15915 [Allomuricauda nanhaiensis]